MSYKDIFGDYAPTTRPQDDDAANPTPPAGRQAETPVPEEPMEPQRQTPETLNFQGFASPLPLLVERPTVYVRRLREATASMVRPPENDTHYGVDGRVLYTPTVSLPFPVLFGDETFANEAVTTYPLLHRPENHPLTDSSRIRVYALTLVAFYTEGGIIHEPGDGNLLAYGLAGQFNADDEAWERAERWATMMADPLDALNRARLLGFALNDPEHENPTLATLFNAWGETRNGDDIINAGREAVPVLEQHYNDFIDIEFRPFSER